VDSPKTGGEFAAKYQFTLPSQDELQREILRERALIENQLAGYVTSKNTKSDWVSGPATIDRFSCEPKQGLWPRAYRQVMLRCGKILTF
jgi:hypothetical protein